MTERRPLDSTSNPKPRTTRDLHFSDQTQLTTRMGFGREGKGEERGHFGTNVMSVGSTDSAEHRARKSAKIALEVSATSDEAW